MNFTRDSKIWQASPWKLKIWIYLYEQANRTDNTQHGLEIKRGQIYRSLRQIAKDCSYKIGYRIEKPSPATTFEVLAELTQEGRIIQRTEHCGTLFTICNYEALRAFPESRSEQRSEQLEGLSPGSFSDETTQQIDELIKFYEKKFPGHIKRFGRLAAISKMRDLIEGTLQDGVPLEAIREKIEKAKDGTPWKILPEEWIAKSKKEKQSYEKLIKLYGDEHS